MRSSPEVLPLFDLLAWRLARALPGLRTGDHPARMRGAGGSFADTAPFLAHPDPRRLDLRRTLTDPMGTLQVRRFQSRVDLTLWVLLDASASLGAGARSDRPGVAALLAAGLAQAAWRGRDRFALTAMAGQDRLLSVPPGRQAGQAAALAAALADLRPDGCGTAGLEEAAREIPGDRVLVAVISDFDHAPDELRGFLAALEPRPVLPFWLRDTGLEAPPGQVGLAAIRDPETGRRRIAVTSRAWADRQAREAAGRRRELRGVLAEFGLSPVEIRDQISVSDLAAALSEVAL
ncbi:hypothetical protein BV509_20610 [Rhodovulum sulfidophilum]|uniref:DUF58 domain-containing protein n=1 Tax=Rhodovulum visakhapatnamense TaxID=364297 RepID=A0ABS1RDX9_9RHOB|nr:hypothetical protein [Rhodovulum visakhapatnamense]MBL3577840.1 hypothetical protein [Rhodovulum visakhapatnamense]OLS42330.1 hypothetical protein BV509_20610 [Rhodovulum sulfidophilum]